MRILMIFPELAKKWRKIQFDLTICHVNASVPSFSIRTTEDASGVMKKVISHLD